MLSQLGTPRIAAAGSDDTGRPLLRINAAPGDGSVLYRPYSARVAFDGCRVLPLSAEESRRHRLDARTFGAPPSRITGPKMLLLRGEVFEPPDGP
jgi:hypothetical protein